MLGPPLLRAGDCSVPKRPPIPWTPPWSLPHSELSPRSTTTASWWRKQQLRACPPACHSPLPAPGKSPLPDTPWTGSGLPHLMLGTLATQGVLDPQPCRAVSLKEGGTWLLGDEVSCPGPCRAGVGVGWKPVPSSHLCQNCGAWRPHGRPPGNKHTRCPESLSWPWFLCGSWSSPHTRSTSQVGCAPSKQVKSWRGGGVATPIPQNGELRLSQGLSQDSRSQRRSFPLFYP